MLLTGPVGTSEAALWTIFSSATCCDDTSEVYEATISGAESVGSSIDVVTISGVSSGVVS